MAALSHKKKSAEQRDLEVRRGFIARFAFYAVVLFTLILILSDEDLQPLLVSYAIVSEGLLRLLGFSVERAGTVLSLGDFSVNVEGQCSALFEISLLVSATLAYPATSAERCRGVIAGTLILLVVNLLRIIGLLLIGSVNSEWFTWAHLYVCQALLVACVAAIWLNWIGQIREFDPS